MRASFCHRKRPRKSVVDVSQMLRLCDVLKGAGARCTSWCDLWARLRVHPGSSGAERPTPARPLAKLTRLTLNNVALTHRWRLSLSRKNFSPTPASLWHNFLLHFFSCCVGQLRASTASRFSTRARWFGGGEAAAAYVFFEQLGFVCRRLRRPPRRGLTRGRRAISAVRSR